MLMRRALEYLRAFDGVIAQHAQDPRLTDGAQMNEGVVSARLGWSGGRRSPRRRSSPATALLAAHVGGRVHFCHVSTGRFGQAGALGPRAKATSFE